MLETLLDIFIEAVKSMGTLITKSKTEDRKRKNETLQNRVEFKRNQLCKVYEKYVSIINSFPNVSPNDILKCIVDPPHYSGEHFNVVIDSLTYKIEDCEDTLKRSNPDLKEKYQIETEIENIKYCITKIEQNKNDYSNAKVEYNKFCSYDKQIIDLYAGRNVRNSMVEFDVVLSNLFIAGFDFEDEFNPEKNVMDEARRKVISAMRDDIGIDL